MMFHNQSNGDLVEAYKRAIGHSADGLKEAATIWCALKERGRDMSDLQGPFVEHFPAIASGRLLPEILFSFGGSLRLVETISTLVPEDQAKLVRPGATVAVLTSSGEVEQRKPAELPIAVARQVLGGGYIRTPEEQRPHLTAPVRIVPPVSSRPSMVGTQHAAVPSFAVPPAATDATALGAALAEAGIGSPEAKLLAIGLDAWAKWSLPEAAGARRDFVRARLQNDLVWVLMSQYQPAVLGQAVGWLLAEAKCSIEAEAPLSRQARQRKQATA